MSNIRGSHGDCDCGGDGSGSGDDGGPSHPLRAQPPLNAALCSSCKDPSIRPIVATRGESVCGDCLSSLIGKRAMKHIGGRENIRYGAKVAIAFSGGLGSMTLVHLFHSRLSSAHSRMKCTSVDLIFCDESATLQPTDASDSVHQYRRCMEALSESVKLLFAAEPAFRLTVVPIESFSADFRAWFGSLPSLSARESALQIARDAVIRRTAFETLDSEFLMYGDTGKTVAVRTMAQLARGNGFALPPELSSKTDIASCGAQTRSILRPLRDILPKEVAQYVRFHRLPHISPPAMGTMATSSIDRASEAFILGLQSQSPGTIHTVLRTVEKLECPVAATVTAMTTSTTTNATAPLTDDAISIPRCALCRDPVAPVDVFGCFASTGLCYRCSGTTGAAAATYAKQKPHTESGATRAVLPRAAEEQAMANRIQLVDRREEWEAYVRQYSLSPDHADSSAAGTRTNVPAGDANVDW